MNGRIKAQMEYDYGLSNCNRTRDPGLCDVGEGIGAGLKSTNLAGPRVRYRGYERSLGNDQKPERSVLEYFLDFAESSPREQDQKEA